MKNQILPILICSVLFSCEQEVRDKYILEITNETNFQINNLIVESESKHVFDLAPNQSTGQFELTLHRYGRARRIEKRTCIKIEIESYSDPSGQYTAVRKGCFSCITELDFEKNGISKFRLTSREYDFGSENCGEYMFLLEK